MSPTAHLDATGLHMPVRLLTDKKIPSARRMGYRWQWVVLSCYPRHNASYVFDVNIASSGVLWCVCLAVEWCASVEEGVWAQAYTLARVFYVGPDILFMFWYSVFCMNRSRLLYVLLRMMLMKQAYYHRYENHMKELAVKKMFEKSSILLRYGGHVKVQTSKREQNVSHRQKNMHLPLTHIPGAK